MLLVGVELLDLLDNLFRSHDDIISCFGHLANNGIEARSEKLEVRENRAFSSC